MIGPFMVASASRTPSTSSVRHQAGEETSGTNRHRVERRDRFAARPAGCGHRARARGRAPRGPACVRDRPRPRHSGWCRRRTPRRASPARSSPARRNPGSPSSARKPPTAARKSPLYCCIIDSSRLPPVCPPSRACSRVGSRASRTRRASPSLRASASAQRRMSPGGSTPSSSRNCPELPPVSNIVTTALTDSHGLRFRPPSRLGRPVPPPKHPIFSFLSCMPTRHSTCATGTIES